MACLRLILLKTLLIFVEMSTVCSKTAFVAKKGLVSIASLKTEMVGARSTLMPLNELISLTTFTLTISDITYILQYRSMLVSSPTKTCSHQVKQLHEAAPIVTPYCGYN